MIGLAGIIGTGTCFSATERETAIGRMSYDKTDFFLNIESLGNVSLAVIKRSNGNNKDLVLKKKGDCLIGFSGYGKFSGDSMLFWADDMAEKIYAKITTEGLETLLFLEGSFLCVVYYNNEFTIISDRVGSKGCYTYSDEEKYLFAPSVSGVLDYGLIKKKKDIDAIVQVLVSGFFLNDRTLVENVRRFPAATILRKKVETNDLEIKKYWDIPDEVGEIREINQDLIESFSEILKRSIFELHDLESRSVVPLSGGLDSRAIACILSEKKKIKSITYDFGDETDLAKKVCRVLGGGAEFFSKKMIKSKSFHKELVQTIRDQQFHSVSNQYFYAPLFRRYFLNHTDDTAIFDGVYMDILFSAPYTYSDFDFDRFMKVYGGSAQLVRNLSYSLNEGAMKQLMLSVYNDIILNHENSDGVTKSQLSYLSGRLRRYVSESYTSRENYCYVFKPGFNYELMDFGYSLHLNIRKGVLYNKMLNEKFPEVMRIKYKDSYGNRGKSFFEKINQTYANARLKLSYASQGLIRYYPYQADYYFYKEKGMDDFEELFSQNNYIQELFTKDIIRSIYDKTKRKQYLMNLFNRVLFVQQFYERNSFQR